MTEQTEQANTRKDVADAVRGFRAWLEDAGWRPYKASELIDPSRRWALRTGYSGGEHYAILLQADPEARARGVSTEPWWTECDRLRLQLDADDPDGQLRAWWLVAASYEAAANSARTEPVAPPSTPDGSLSLSEMQANQPWTAPYSAAYLESRDSLGEVHRDAMHAVLHLVKALGVLASVSEWADHTGGQPPRLDRVGQAEWEGRISDLVMCALYLANHPPNGYARFDLQQAVVDRTKQVNGRGFE